MLCLAEEGCFDLVGLLRPLPMMMLRQKLEEGDLKVLNLTSTRPQVPVPGTGTSTVPGSGYFSTFLMCLSFVF